MATMIIALIIFGMIGGIIYKKFKQYKNGGISCGCSCSNCSSSKSCSKK